MYYKNTIFQLFSHPTGSIWPISCTISCNKKVKKKNIKKCFFKLVTIDSHAHWVTIAGTNVLKLPTIRKISFSMHIFDLLIAGLLDKPISIIQQPICNNTINPSCSINSYTY